MSYFVCKPQVKDNEVGSIVVTYAHAEKKKECRMKLVNGKCTCKQE